MPDVLEYLESEKQRHLDAATDVNNQAKKEVRHLTEDERDSVQTHLKSAKELQDKIKASVDSDNLQASIDSLSANLTSEPERVEPGKARSIGQAFVQSDAYQALKERGAGTDKGKFTTGPIMIPMRIGTVAGTVSEDAGSNAEMLLPTRIPGIQGPAEPPLRVADLFNQGTVTRGNSLLLVRETVSVNAADVVAERGAKPPSDIQFDTELATLEKIATVIKVSDEMLEDEELMAGYLNGRLGLFVRQKEETKIIAELLAQAGQTADETDVNGDNIFDAIVAGIAKVEDVGGLVADTVLMSVMDWARMSVLKAQTSGMYYSGGPYAAPDQNPWGVRLVKSGRLGDGNAVVGAFREGGSVWRKGGGVSVEATNSNEDDFDHNLVSIRAEERMTLFLERVDAFCKVSLSS